MMDFQSDICYNEGNHIRNAPALLSTAGSVSQRSTSPMTTPIVVPPVDSHNLKRCCHCHEWKPREAFSRCKSRRDGLQVQCKACKNEYSRAHYTANAEQQRRLVRAYGAANKERRSEYAREYYAANAERIAEKNREYYAVNAEHIAERGRAYRQSDAGKAAIRARNHNRRARKLEAGGTCTASDLIAIRTAQTDAKGRLICWKCGRPIKGTPHLDHWIPLDKGGTNDPGNLHYMHAKCNISKGAKHPTELGRLV